MKRTLWRALMVVALLSAVFVVLPVSATFPAPDQVTQPDDPAHVANFSPPPPVGDDTYTSTAPLTIGNAGAAHFTEQNISSPTAATEVQLRVGANPAAPWAPTSNVNLVVDDGSAENSIGITGGGQFVWLNRFTPAAGSYPFTLDQVSALFDSNTAAGSTMQIVVWEDTDGDGDPGTGANFLYDQAVTVQVNDGATWNVYTLTTPVALTGPGDVLIGMVNRSGASGTLDFPAVIDQTAPSQRRSWFGTYAGAPPNPPTLPGVTNWGIIDDLSALLAGNWMLRGDGHTGASVDITATVDHPSITALGLYTLTYTTIVANPSTFYAFAPAFTYTLDSHLTLVSMAEVVYGSLIVPPIGSVYLPTKSWRAISMGPGSVVTVTLVATGTLMNVPGPGSGSLWLPYWVTTLLNGWNGTGWWGPLYLHTNVQGFSNLLQVNASGPTTAKQGDVITYAITFSNTGTLPVYNVWVTDTLPAGVVPLTGATSRFVPVLPANTIFAHSLPVRVTTQGVTLINRVNIAATSSELSSIVGRPAIWNTVVAKFYNIYLPIIRR